MADTPEHEPVSPLPYESLIRTAVRWAGEMRLDKPDGVPWLDYIEGCRRGS